jgi:hypothetical protein
LTWRKDDTTSSCIMAGATEGMMAQRHDGTHTFRQWATHRLDEMEATLASLEDEATHLQAGLRAEAERAIAGLKRRRDAFRALATAELHAGEATLHDARARLDGEWTRFEAEVDTYLASLGGEIGQRSAAFRSAAAAQARSWRAVADELQAEAAGAAAIRRAQLEEVIRQVKQEAAAADANMDRLREAGRDSWATLRAGLTESRKVFERAAHKAWETLNRGGS